MSTLLSRFATQLGLSLAGVAALAALGEPLPLPAPVVAVEVLAEDLRDVVADEVAAAKQAAEAETAALRQTAARIRWLITAPGAGIKPLRLRSAVVKQAQDPLQSAV